METNCAYSILFESTCNNNTRYIIMRPKGSCNRGPSERFNDQCNKSTYTFHHMSMMLCFCFAFLDLLAQPKKKRSRNLRACDKSAAAFFRRSADGSCKHGNPEGGRSTGCQATPSRLTRLNERFARHYHLLILGWNFLRTPHLVLKYFWMRLTTLNPHTFPMTAQCHIPAFWDFSARIFSREPSSAAWSNVRSAEASVSHLQLG